MENGNNKELILIVDDEPKNLQILGSILKQRGFKTGIAQNGMQALEFIKNKLPDIILLDVMMPEMDGFEVCRQIKAMETLKDIPILFITALTDNESMIKGFQSGGSDYIHKPIVQEEVIARIQVHLDNRRFIRNLAETNDRLQELNLLKNRFLGMAAHDLRNPLGSIMGFTELILMEDFGTVSEEQKPVLERIYGASQRMLDLVNDLLDVSVIESGKLTLKKTEGLLKEIIIERLELIQPIAAKKGIHMTTAFQTDGQSEFDQERIAQVVDNIVGNAIKFSPPDSQIETELRNIDGHLEFLVHDSGPGISEEEQKSMFGEFHQLSTKPTAGEKGTGLGLAISKKIVDAHNGEIRVDSVPGQGTTFYVILPAGSK